MREETMISSWNKANRKHINLNADKSNFMLFHSLLSSFHAFFAFAKTRVLLAFQRMHLSVMLFQTNPGKHVQQDSELPRRSAARKQIAAAASLASDSQRKANVYFEGTDILLVVYISTARPCNYKYLRSRLQWEMFTLNIKTKVLRQKWENRGSWETQREFSSQ